MAAGSGSAFCCRGPPGPTGRAPGWRNPWSRSASASCGLTSLIYSLFFLVAKWAFSSLPPRLNLFRDDRSYGAPTGWPAASSCSRSPRCWPSETIPKCRSSCRLPRGTRPAAAAAVPDRDMVRSAGRPAATRSATAPRCQHPAVVVLRVRIGDTLQEGAPAVDLHGGEMTDAAVLAALATGQERTFHQDPMFAFRLLADITCERYRRPSTTRPPLCRCYTRSRAACRSWCHATWTWLR